MSAERLKSLVEQGNLINLNIVSDSLGTLLHEITAMLVDQQRQINQINKDMEEKLDSKDFNSFSNQWRNDRDVLFRSFPNFEANIQKVLKDVDHKNEEIREHIDQSIDQVLMSVDTRIIEKMGDGESDVVVLQSRIDQLEQKLKTASGSITKQDFDTVKKRLLKVESDLTVVAHPKFDTSIIDKFKDEMNKKFEELNNTVQTRLIPEEEFAAAGPNGETSRTTGSKANGDTKSNSDNIEELTKKLETAQSKIDELSRTAITKNSWTQEVGLVERMFDKMRTIVTTLKDEVNSASEKFGQCVTKTEMQAFVENIIIDYLEKNDTVSSPPLKCTNYGSVGSPQNRKRTGSQSQDANNSTLPVLLVPRRS